MCQAHNYFFRSIRNVLLSGFAQFLIPYKNYLFNICIFGDFIEYDLQLKLCMYKLKQNINKVQQNIRLPYRM